MCISFMLKSLFVRLKGTDVAGYRKKNISQCFIFSVLLPANGQEFETEQ